MFRGESEQVDTEKMAKDEAYVHALTRIVDHMGVAITEDAREAAEGLVSGQEPYVLCTTYAAGAARQPSLPSGRH